MKIRTDYVTNSSSSSFIISRNDISEENLLKLLLELANETAWWDDEEEDAYRYTDEDFEYYSDENCISIANFYLREATEDKPYNSYYEWDKYFSYTQALLNKEKWPLRAYLIYCLKKMIYYPSFIFKSTITEA